MKSGFLAWENRRCRRFGIARPYSSDCPLRGPPLACHATATCKSPDSVTRFLGLPRKRQEFTHHLIQEVIAWTTLARISPESVRL